MKLHEFVEKAIDVPFVEKGRDYNGWDCWGLIFCAYRDLFGIKLHPYLDYDSTVEYKQLKKLIDAGKPQWKQEKNNITMGCVAVFTIGGNACHVGLVLGGNEMIHAEKACGTIIETYNGLIWGKRLEGIYRYNSAVA